MRSMINILFVTVVYYGQCSCHLVVYVVSFLNHVHLLVFVSCNLLSSCCMFVCVAFDFILFFPLYNHVSCNLLSIVQSKFWSPVYPSFIILL